MYKNQQPVLGVNLKAGTFKTLGIWFAQNETEMIQQNFN